MAKTIKVRTDFINIQLDYSLTIYIGKYFHIFKNKFTITESDYGDTAALANIEDILISEDKKFIEFNSVFKKKPTHFKIDISKHSFTYPLVLLIKYVNENNFVFNKSYSTKIEISNRDCLEIRLKGQSGDDPFRYIYLEKRNEEAFIKAPFAKPYFHADFIGYEIDKDVLVLKYKNVRSDLGGDVIDKSINTYSFKLDIQPEFSNTITFLLRHFLNEMLEVNEKWANNDLIIEKDKRPLPKTITQDRVNRIKQVIAGIGDFEFDKENLAFEHYFNFEEEEIILIVETNLTGVLKKSASFCKSILKNLKNINYESFHLIQKSNKGVEEILLKEISIKDNVAKFGYYVGENDIGHLFYYIKFDKDLKVISEPEFENY